jgi:hypothetical protein
MQITQVGARVLVKSKATGGKKLAKPKPKVTPITPAVTAAEPAAAAAVDDGDDDSQASEQRLLWYRPVGSLHEALGSSVNPQFAFDFTPVLPVPKSVWKVRVQLVYHRLFHELAFTRMHAPLYVHSASTHSHVCMFL